MKGWCATGFEPGYPMSQSNALATWPPPTPFLFCFATFLIDIRHFGFLHDQLLPFIHLGFHHRRFCKGGHLGNIDLILKIKLSQIHYIILFYFCELLPKIIEPSSLN